MPVIAADSALKFVREVALPAAPRISRSPVASPQLALDAAKSQALVVGSDVVSFVEGVSSETRHDIVNCTLLAQLVANKRVADKENIRAWYEAFFDALTQIGCLVQEKGFTEHREKADNFEANQAILSVASVLLGPAATALAVVQSTLEAMKSMSDGPWITIFNREAQTARAARFQLTLAEPAGNGAMISLMAFDLKAKAELTQVLFFKFRSTDVTLRHASGKVTMLPDVLANVREAMAQRIKDYTSDYIAKLDI